MYAPVEPAEQKFLVGRQGRTHLWFHSGPTCSRMQYSLHQNSSALTPRSLQRQRESQFASLNLKRLSKKLSRDLNSFYPLAKTWTH